MPISPLKRFVLVALFSGIAVTAFAEDAPVYDVDSYPPQFDGQSEAARPASKMQSSGDNQAYARPSAPADNQQSFGPPAGLTMDQRVQRLEQQNNNSLNSDVTTKMNDMQTEMQSLRGQVEELTHQIQQLQTQQKTMYSDLDKRVGGRGSAAVASTDADAAAADAASATVSPPAATDVPAAPKPKKTKQKTVTPVVASAAVANPDDASVDAGATDKPAKVATDTTAATDPAAASVAKTDSQPNVAEEQQIYQTAYSLIKAKKYNEAATTLQKMLHKYPSGQFAANAHYWLGELYGLMSKNDQAVLEFNNVVKNYPDSPKLADAQLKLGLLFAAQFKWTDAKSSFKKVINHYPGTSSAHLAAEQLKQIKQAGH
jgi:tol-pal system protein YbgF